MRISKFVSIISLSFLAVLSLTSCEDSKSYSDLLREEEKAVNWYLAQQNVILDIPENGNFQTGENAPFYKMDKDGYVYMQVVTKGNMDDRPKKGEAIYFRFMRMDIKTLYETGAESWEGNMGNLSSLLGNTSLIYGNTVLESTVQYGEGIQVPLEYLGYNSEVNLIVKSPEGFTTDMSQCLPYVYNIKYFKAEY